MSSINDKPSIEARHDRTTDNAVSEDMKRKALIRLLQSWREGDEQEQIETLKLSFTFSHSERMAEYLRKATTTWMQPLHANCIAHLSRITR